MITVACVLRTGERYVGGSYSPDHVRKLAAGVAQHISAAYKFVCLSDVDVPCERIPLESDWPGWWAKMELYRLSGTVIYLDLDSLVTGDLASMARSEPGFTMVSDFNMPEQGNSSAMSWNGDYSGLTDEFAKNPDAIMAHYDAKGRGPKIGDQGYVHDTLKSVDFFPASDVVSFKKHARNYCPASARVVSFHGKPKCDEKAAGWAYEAWSRL